MAAYLKLEEHIEGKEVSLLDDLMGISLLALLLSPFAGIGIILSMLGLSAITPALMATCAFTVAAAIPKVLQLIVSDAPQLEAEPS